LLNLCALLFLSIVTLHKNCLRGFIASSVRLYLFFADRQFSKNPFLVLGPVIQRPTSWKTPHLAVFCARRRIYSVAEVGGWQDADAANGKMSTCVSACIYRVTA